MKRRHLLPRWGRVPVVAGSAAGLILAGLGGVVAGSTASAAVLTNGSTYAIVGALDGCSGPYGMTVVRNGVSDDTVYVACFGGDSVAYIADDSTSASVSGEILLPVGSAPTFLASIPIDTLGTADDTVYAVSDDTVSIIPSGELTSTSNQIVVGLGGEISGVAVSNDDTLYVSFDDTFVLYGDDTIGVGFPGTVGPTFDDSFAVDIDAYNLLAYDDTLFSSGFFSNGDEGLAGVNMITQTLDDSAILALSPWRGALTASDDTLFAMGDDSALWSFDPRTLAPDDSVLLQYDVVGARSNPAGLLAATSTEAVEIIDGIDMTVLATIEMPAGSDVSGSEAVTRSGVVYVGNFFDSLIYRIAELTPSLNQSSGAGGTAVELDVAPSASDVTVDDTTVVSVSFGGTSVAGSSMTRTGNTFTFNAPAGSGTVAVTANFYGGTSVVLGNWTYPADPTPPTPPVTYPPSAPLDAKAEAGNAKATVTWSTPSSSGSFAITDYQAVASPGGATCMVKAPALTCEVDKLANGTEYTFKVRALNGAGWGPYSESSNAVTPSDPNPPVEMTIQVSGTRGDVRGKPGVIVTGETTGFEMGAVLKPWIKFPGQTSYSEGSASILVDEAGDFTWSRRTGKKIYIIVKSADGAVKSNRLIIEAR